MVNNTYDFLNAQSTLDQRIAEINLLLTSQLISTVISQDATVEDSTNLVLNKGKDKYRLIKGRAYLIDTGSGPISRAIIAGFYEEDKKTNVLMIDREKGWYTCSVDQLVDAQLEFM